MAIQLDDVDWRAGERTPLGLGGVVFSMRHHQA
jgi:hypothetical protein